MSKLAEEIAESLWLQRPRGLEISKELFFQWITAPIDGKLSGVRGSAKTLLGVTSTIHPEDAILIKNMYESLKVDR